MNIYKFINSKDIAEYLTSINYQFSTIEAAYLVYQCRSATLEEKIEAWKEIIKTYPDCTCERRTFATKSMHGFLEEYIALQEKCINRFLDQDEAVYCFKFRYANGESGDYNEDILFSNFEKCYEFVIHEVADRSVHLDKIVEFDIKKVWLNYPGDYGKQITLTFNESYGIKEVDDPELSCEESDIMLAFFEMWIEIPTPFKRGDILVNCKWPDSEPRVLDYLCTWDTTAMIASGACESEKFVLQADERVAKMRKNGDISDMNAYGFEIDDRENIWNDEFGFADYLDLEYYRKPLEGKRRFLRAISSFLQEKINLELLMNSYRAIWMEEDNKEYQQWYKLMYSKDCYSLVGMREEKQEK